MGFHITVCIFYSGRYLQLERLGGPLMNGAVLSSSFSFML